MNHYVYEITNHLNGKKYIGKRSTHTDIDRDNYWGSGIAIKQAIKKYGKENFSKTILHICDSEEDAYNQEELEIEKVKAYDSDSYYNIAKGGLGVHYGSVKVKKKKSIPPDFKYRPPIFNPDEYIENLKSDFENTDGYALFKLKYLCGYLILQHQDKNIVSEIIFALTKQYGVSHSFTEHEWMGIIENVYSEMSTMPKEEIEKIYKTKEITIYKSEMKEIMMLPNIFLKKSALTFLIIYKFFYQGDIYVERHDNWLKKIYGSFSNRKSKALQGLLEKGYIVLKENHFTIPFAIFNDERADIFETLTKYSANSLLLIDLYTGENIIKCQKCGELISGNKSGTKRYCVKCKTYSPKKIRYGYCIDCGSAFVTISNAVTKVRCDSCQKRHNSLNKKAWRKLHNSKKVMQEL